ncbi:MAG TPA: hypothetical protein VHC67_10035, partial [Gaiellaceae bacterium]|nr:hypothetical protein [Gaiellaceae bacterium]
MSETLRIDTDRIPDAALVRWAKARIAADAYELGIQLEAIGELGKGRLDAGLHFSIGAVLVRNNEGDVYTIGPVESLVALTADGRER